MKPSAKLNYILVCRFSEKNVEKLRGFPKENMGDNFFPTKIGFRTTKSQPPTPQPPNPSTPQPPKPQGPSAPPRLCHHVLTPWGLGGGWVHDDSPRFGCLGFKEFIGSPFFETPKNSKKKHTNLGFKQKKRGVCLSLLNMNRFRK